MKRWLLPRQWWRDGSGDIGRLSISQLERRLQEACPDAAREWLRRISAGDSEAVRRYDRIVAQAAAEDSSAQNLLFLLHADEAVGWARQKLGGRIEDACDAVQSGFVLALASLPSANVQNFRAWLRTIVTRQAVSALRKLIRINNLHATPARSSVPRPDEAAGESELCAEIWRVVRQLPRRERAVVAMLSAEMTYSEIAEALGVSLGTVSGIIHRLRRELRESPLQDWLDQAVHSERPQELRRASQ